MVECDKCFTLHRICSALVPECYDGDVRLSSSINFTLLSFNVQFTNGFLEVCYQGSWISVCLNSTYSTSTDQLAELACRSTSGSNGMSFKISLVSYKIFVLSYSCYFSNPTFFIECNKNLFHRVSSMCDIHCKHSVLRCNLACSFTHVQNVDHLNLN